MREIELDLAHRATGRTLGGFAHRARQLVDFVRVYLAARGRLAREMILAIDQGTTGTTCLVFDEQAEPIGRAYREFTQHFPQPGWVEHDAARDLGGHAGRRRRGARGRRACAPGELAAVGITNQRETVCVWDPATRRAAAPRDRLAGPPHRRALRGAARAGHEPLVRERTGLVLDPYFSATKIAVAARARRRAARARARAGARVFGTIDSWLVFKLTGEHVTDPSNASRTMLYDIAAGRWDPELLELFGVPERALPRVCAERGRARRDARRGAARPRASRSRASPATSRRRCSARPASTRAWARTPTAPARSCSSTPASRAPEPARRAARRRSPGASAARRAYALEASIFVTGAAVQWLRDGLGIIERAAETEALAASLDGNDGVYFVPALTGLGSPHWDPARARHDRRPHARQRRAHLARATLEAIAYQTVDAVRAMEAACGRAAARAARRRRRDRQRAG